MVGLAMPGRVRRHVGEHHVGRSAEQGFQAFGRIRVEKVEMQRLDAGDRRHLQEIDRDHASPALVAPRASPRFWLQPPGAAPRSTTRAPGLRSEPVVDLDQLCRRRASAGPRAWRAPRKDR